MYPLLSFVSYTIMAGVIYPLSAIFILNQLKIKNVKDNL